MQGGLQEFQFATPQEIIGMENGFATLGRIESGGFNAFRLESVDLILLGVRHGQDLLDHEANVPSSARSEG